MKKALIILFAAMLLFCAPISALAGDSVPAVPAIPAASSVTSVTSAPAAVSDEAEFNYVPFVFITGENDDFQPQNEYSLTFSKKITLNAESLRGAKINLSVSYGEEAGILPKVYEEVIIGPSLKYIQPLALELGDNFIALTIEKDGYDTKTIEAVIKRKDMNIMESLQNLIVIPGMIK